MASTALQDEPPSPQPPITRDDGVLPDFCRGEQLVNVIVLAEFLAIAATVVARPITGDVFRDLFAISLFVQWIALGSAAVLCGLRRTLNRLPPARAVLMAYLLLLCVTWAVSEAAVWVLWAAGLEGSPRPGWYVRFHLQTLTVSAILCALVLRYFLARHQLRQTTLAQARARAEIQRLRVRPHFLYNGMNVIAGLAHRAPARAGDAMEDMADLVRLMLDDSKSVASLSSELDVARKYVNLEKLRLENRLRVRWEVARVPRHVRTPVLMLQLLLEAAIRLGVEPHPAGGTIGVTISMEGEALRIVVSCAAAAGPGGEDAGSRDEFVDAVLVYVRHRLNELYGARAQFVTRLDPGHYVLEIRHPIDGGLT